jgi:hypothetical protein
VRHQAFLIFTLTRANADRLSWLDESADQQEALAVEVHSLCSFGAASVNLSQAISDSREFRVASWLLALLPEWRGRGGPEIALDVIDRRRVEASHWLRQTNDAACAATAPFADLVPTLIVEPDGCLTPFIYGFPRHWAVGHLGRLADGADSARGASIPEDGRASPRARKSGLLSAFTLSSDRNWRPQTVALQSAEQKRVEQKETEFHRAQSRSSSSHISA